MSALRDTPDTDFIVSKVLLDQIIGVGNRQLGGAIEYGCADGLLVCFEQKSQKIDTLI